MGAPLVLISQMARSGGTLLLRMLDSHPQLAVMPHEFRFQVGQPGSLIGADWSDLCDPKLDWIAQNGFTQAMRKLNRDEAVHEFAFDHEVASEVFRSRPRSDERQVVDAYFDGYFAGWVNRQGSGDQWRVVFKPNVIRQAGKTRRIFDLYPDGRLISIIRNPSSWWASARLWGDRWSTLDAGVASWSESARAACKWKQVLGDRALLISYESLVTQPEHEAHRIADWLGIDYSPSMLTPTFNGGAINANSSFPADTEGRISAAPADRAKLLSPDEHSAIEQATSDLYDQALALVR